MRIFMYELKKIWNWRVLTIIVTMFLLTWFAVLREPINTYDSLTTHGIYGSYQKELFELYGDTLEPEELAEYDIPGKKEAIIEELNEIIKKEPIFAENHVYNFEQFEDFITTDYENLSKEEAEKRNETIFKMHDKLDYGDRVNSLDEWYDSPLMKFYAIQALEAAYINYKDKAKMYFSEDQMSPIFGKALDKIIKMRNANLIQYHLTEEFSMFAMEVGIFTIITLIILISPLLTTDRMRNINKLQYSSTVGRNILKYQFGATMLSAGVLSILMIVVSFIIFLLSGPIDYWNARIMGVFSFGGIYLYNITFGQYVFILAGMILAFSVSTACFTFILARFSMNIVMLLVKAVPAGIALATLFGLSAYEALSDLNFIFDFVFRRKIHVPEIILCGVIVAIAISVAVIILKREKRVEII